MTRKNFIILKTKTSLKGVFLVIKRPKYALLALGLSVVFIELLFWINNINLLFYILTTPTLDLYQKITFLASSYSGIWQSTASVLAVILIVISFVQGIMLACLVYIIKRRRTTGVIKTVGSSGISSILAALGLGCAACGTSLITPILTLLFSTTSTTLADSVGSYVMFVALLLSFYGLYSIGLKTGQK